RNRSDCPGRSGRQFRERQTWLRGSSRRSDPLHRQTPWVESSKPREERSQGDREFVGYSRQLKKSILLVLLALFYVMVHGFGPNLAVVGPKSVPSFSLRLRR